MKHKTKRILTLLTAVVLVLALPVMGASAADLEFGTDGKVTNTTALKIYIGPYTDTSGYYADIKTAAVTVDLYKVADAVHEPAGADHGMMYVFSPAASFTTDMSKTTSYDGLKDLTNTAWRAMAQGLANEMFDETGASIPSGVTKVSLQAAANAGITSSANVGAGLYLVIAHGTALGTDASKYVVKDGGNVRTKAESDYYVYYYTPELIALPTTTPTMGEPVNSPADTQPAGTYNDPLPTTAGGDWQTEVTALLKPTRTYRMGKLVIRKNLPAIEEHSNATFIFHVDAEYDYGGPGETLTTPITMYNNDLSISFNTQAGGGILAYTDPTTGNSYIELPVGTKVTVSEIYPGSCYEQDGPTEYSIADQRIPVPATEDTALVVTTKNKYNGNIITGYGIENTFQWNGSKWIHYVTDPATSGGGTK